VSETPFLPVAEPEGASAPSPAVTMRAIDVIRQRTVTARRMLRVPEWELDLYFGPLTANDFLGIQDREPKTIIERNLMLLVMKAQTEDGRPLFAFGDMHVLKNEVAFPILTRLIEFMFESAFPSVEAATKELAVDPTSASGSA